MQLQVKFCLDIVRNIIFTMTKQNFSIKWFKIIEIELKNIYKIVY